jgi:hypothetical protein
MEPTMTNRQVTELQLKRGLDRIYTDFGNKVSKRTILVYARGNVEVAEQFIEVLQTNGYVRVIVPLRACSEEEHCIEILRGIPDSIVDHNRES